jgi:hypothetical protein
MGKIEKWITRGLVFTLAYWMLQASGIMPAIIPAAVPAAFKQGNSTKFQIAKATGSGTSGICAEFDANHNLVDAASGGPCQSSSSGYTTIQDEGSNLPQQQTLNFTGNAVACANGTGKTDCTISVGSNTSWWPSNPTASTPPALVSWTLIDPDTNAVTANVTGGVMLNHPSGNTIAQLYVATPGAAGSAFTLTAHLSAYCPVVGACYGRRSTIRGTCSTAGRTGTAPLVSIRLQSMP